MMGKSRLIELRRDKVQSLLLRGLNQVEISARLNVPTQTINRDCIYLREQAAKSIETYSNSLALRNEQTMLSIDKLLSEMWDLKDSCKYERNKVSAGALVKEIIALRHEVNTDVTAVDRAVKHIEGLRKKARSITTDSTRDDEKIDITAGHAF